jgi:hypothetical protein
MSYTHKNLAATVTLGPLSWFQSHRHKIPRCVISTDWLLKCCHCRFFYFPSLSSQWFLCVWFLFWRNSFLVLRLLFTGKRPCWLHTWGFCGGGIETKKGANQCLYNRSYTCLWSRVQAQIYENSFLVLRLLFTGKLISLFILTVFVFTHAVKVSLLPVLTISTFSNSDWHKWRN